MCQVGDSIGWGEISKWRQAFPFCGFGWIIIIIAVAVVILRCCFVSSALLYTLQHLKLYQKPRERFHPTTPREMRGRGRQAALPFPLPPLSIPSRSQRGAARRLRIAAGPRCAPPGAATALAPPECGALIGRADAQAIHHPRLPRRQGARLSPVLISEDGLNFLGFSIKN